jgi:transcriptional regulator with XRE-family HTH domain
MTAGCKSVCLPRSRRCDLIARTDMTERKIQTHVSEVKTHASETPARTSKRRPPKRDESFIARLTELIEECNPRTQGALAKRVELSERSIGYYMNGSDPKRRPLMQIAEKTGVSLDWLVAGRGIKRPSTNIDEDLLKEAARIIEADLAPTKLPDSAKTIALLFLPICQKLAELPKGMTSSERRASCQPILRLIKTRRPE